MNPDPEDESAFLDDCLYVAARDSTRYPLSPNIIRRPRPLGSDSQFEAHSDYYGFPSNPLSIYRTGDPWPRPFDPQAQRVPKEARPICVHPIAPVWRKLGRQIYQYFDSVDLRWTIIDPVRFAEIGNEAGPLFLPLGGRNA